MKITSIETLSVNAGWKNWLFVRVSTDSDLHGIGEGTLNGFIRTTEAAIRELEVSVPVVRSRCYGTYRFAIGRNG